MTVRLSTALRNKLAGPTGFGTTFNNGVIYVYSGPQPLTADAAVQGTLLGIVSVASGAFAFGSPANGLQFDAPVAGTVSKAAAQAWSFAGIAAGTAGWFRLMGNAVDDLAVDNGFVHPRLDGSIGVTGADLNLSNLSVTPAAPNTIDVFAFTIPAQ